MSRYFMIQSWVGSHENEPDYNGQQCGERNVRSIEAVPLYDQFGNANVSAFSDAAIEVRRERKKTSVPLVDRVLPQQRRVRVLTEQLYELEAERKNGLDIRTYSQLRDILICKRSRAEELLKKAVSVKPVNKYADDPDLYEETGELEQGFYATNHVNDVHHTSTWVDDLPDSNSLKRPIKIVCTLVKGLVKWHNRTKAYIQTLKEV